MTTERNDFAPTPYPTKELLLADFAGDTFRLILNDEAEEQNVDLAIREGGEETTFSLGRDDCETLLGVLANILLNSSASE